MDESIVAGFVAGADAVAESVAERGASLRPPPQLSKTAHTNGADNAFTRSVLTVRPTLGVGHEARDLVSCNDALRSRFGICRD
jgi:hypothetical protein